MSSLLAPRWWYGVCQVTTVGIRAPQRAASGTPLRRSILPRMDNGQRCHIADVRLSAKLVRLAMYGNSIAWLN
jgi:hypothetical protein